MHEFAFGGPANDATDPPSDEVSCLADPSSDAVSSTDVDCAIGSTGDGAGEGVDDDMEDYERWWSEWEAGPTKQLERTVTEMYLGGDGAGAPAHGACGGDTSSSIETPVLRPTVGDHDAPSPSYTSLLPNTQSTLENEAEEDCVDEPADSSLMSSPSGVNDSDLTPFLSELMEPSVPSAAVPTVLNATEDFWVLLKPSDWLCGCDHAESEGDSAHSYAALVDPKNDRKIMYVWPWHKLDTKRHPILRSLEYQYGHVHRLDRFTSGPLCIAKTYPAYKQLKQFLHRQLFTKIYVALAHGVVYPPCGTINKRLIKESGGRSVRCVTVGDRSGAGMTATTHYTVMGIFVREGTGGEKTYYSLLSIKIETGRTHQIRAHIAEGLADHHPLVGDLKYARKDQRPYVVNDSVWCRRQFLHGLFLAIPSRPDGGGYDIETYVPLPADLLEVLRSLKHDSASLRSLYRRPLPAHHAGSHPHHLLKPPCALTRRHDAHRR